MFPRLNYQQTKYLKSAATLDQLPQDIGAEVAFIGFSNSGKSSVLNTITGIKGLARVSSTPGRTQTINFFSLTSKQRLVDLPGYGYAKVPLSVKERWAKNVNNYLQLRGSLRGIILTMDIRHPLKELDYHLIMWAVKCYIPIHILLTKADKLAVGAKKKALYEVRERLELYGEQVSVQLFSSLERSGVEEVHTKLNEWLSETAHAKNPQAA